ncbi:MAG: 4-hydroxythreonine-4-phosphate dehydrogenase PdxA [Betaproteobacteria bacterium]
MTPNALRTQRIVAVTAGEPAGIGPELCAMLAARHAQAPFAARIVVIGNRELLVARAQRIGIDVEMPAFDPARIADLPPLCVWDVPLVTAVMPGRLDIANAAHVMAMLSAGCDACAMGDFAALVTAPVQKSVLLDAGIAFSGHTEYFAARTHTTRVVMMLVGSASDAPLRVALATTHLPLSAVPAAITRQVVTETLAITAADLRTKFGIAAPRIGVCGLNPHAGEGGHLGREEIDVIAPAISGARAAGIDAEGPFPADTLFVPLHARRFDAIVAMYHDQGLPVLKAASFGGGVNVTLGLPFIRTSVDHGTALDLAGDAARAKTADPGSLYAAIDLAIDLARAGCR